MATALRFCRGLFYNYNQSGRSSEFLKVLYEFWGYAVNGTSALQTPGGMATTMSLSYSISNTTGAGVSPIVVTTTTTNALFTGQQVNISGVTGNFAANGIYQITVTSGSTFSLNSTTGNGSYTGGGTVNTTPFAWTTNFTEGVNVLATGSDGYTAAQVSTTVTGDAFFTAQNTNPFTSTATSLNVTTASNYQTTIAAGSNGASLPQSTINVASTTTFSTTITATSNNVSLPTGTINVVSTVGFPIAGTIFVTTTEGTFQITYTGTTATTFTGCTGGIGSMFTGAAVLTTFPTSGNINVTTNAGVQLVTYTGITGTTFTGCSGGTGSMSTGGAINAPIQLTTSVPNSYNNLQSVNVTGVIGNTAANGPSIGGTWTISIPSYNINTANFFNTAVAFPSNGVTLPQATINSTTAAPFTTTTGVQTLPTSTINVAATATAATTIIAASNGATLPQGTVNATSTTGFPTSGTINVFATPFASITVPSNLQTLPQSVINVNSTSGFPTSGNILVGTSITTTTTGVQTLPTGTINVTSTTGFSASGTLFITTTNGPQIVTYTGGGGGGTTFTGCTGGTGNTSNGGAVAQATTVAYTGTTGISFTGCTGGTGTMITAGSVAPPAPVAQTVTYTGVTATTYTGCLGGIGLMQTGNAVNNTGFFTNFPTTGTVYIVTTTGAQPVSYTGVGATTLTGCTNGTGNTSSGGSVFTSFSPASVYTSIAAGSNGAVLPQTTINVTTTTGFPTSGYVYVTTTTGFQVVTYTGVSGGNQFTGCSGGTGTMSTGNAVFEACPPTGTINITSTLGTQTVSYTGTTATTFTGGSGGVGTIATGNTILTPSHITTSLGATLTTGQTAAINGVVGANGVNGLFTVTRIDNRNFVLNSSVPSGSYISGGTVTDNSNFILVSSAPNGSWTSGGTVTTTNMVGKLFVMWKPNSGTSEDAVYLISAVVSPNTIRINMNTGGTPDPTTNHPSFNQRSNINYRVVEGGTAQLASSGNGNYMVMQFNPSAIGINPGQANSQVQVFGNDSAGSIGINVSPGGNWNGAAFPVTGNIQIDATGQNTSFSGGYFNGSPSGNLVMNMAADPCFFNMHFKDVNSGDGSSYIHVEIPTRLYPQALDTNPVAWANRGGVFNGSVFNLGNGSGQNFGRLFGMKAADGVTRIMYSLAKSLFGDGSVIFGTSLTDIRLAFNTTRGTVLASDCILSLPSVTNQFSLGRVKLRTIKFTSTPLPLYHRFGTAGGGQFINVQNGIAIIWDNTIVPQNLFYII